MTLNLYNILQEVLNEAVNSDAVIDAISNKQQVIINYSDEDDHAPGKRIVEPYVYGLTVAGNPCFRGFQYEGDTFRGKPKWKLFRLDRVTSWQPTERHFNTTPASNGWPAEGYNEEGDKSMSQVIYQVHFGDNKEIDSLEAARAKTARLQNSTPINISQIEEPNESGAITNDKVENPNNYYTNQKQEPVIRGAISPSNMNDTAKGKDYWKDFAKANKEKNQQNRKERKKNYDNTRYFTKKADKKKLINNPEEENENNI